LVPDKWHDNIMQQSTHFSNSLDKLEVDKLGSRKGTADQLHTQVVGYKETRIPDLKK